jgi:high-affinity K+ transport system ATPase subunit B
MLASPVVFFRYIYVAQLAVIFLVPLALNGITFKKLRSHKKNLDNTNETE